MMRGLRGLAGRSQNGIRPAGHWSALAPLILVAAVLAGCSFGPNELPSPRAGVSTDYDVTIRFASVMNLPQGADVAFNGLRIGTVKQMKQTAEGVDVTVGLNGGAKVPADVHAIIQQNTLLGDTYIALMPPSAVRGGNGSSAAASAARMAAGAVIPVERTTSPPQLEDTIAVLAYFVNGGSIQKAQDTMTTLNRTLPEKKQVRKLSTTVAVDLNNLATRTDEIDRTLNGLNNVSMSFQRTGDQFRQMMSPAGAEYWNRVAHDVVGHISTLLPSVGSIFIGGLWLVPMLNSLADTVESVRMVWDKGVVVGQRLDAFLRNTLVPFSRNPRVDVTSVKGDGGRELVSDSQNVLRILGAIR